MRTKAILSAAVALALAACGKPAPEVVGVKTDALDAAAWEASQWISAADAPVITERNADLAADGASWFVGTFTNAKKVASVRWMTTGLGVYQLYLNGTPVGEEALKPGFTDYRKTKRSFTYDITDAFVRKAGAENVLSAQVTPGWWADRVVTPWWVEGMNGRKCAFRSVLEVTYADGSKERFGTDTEHWKAGIAGPVKHAAIYDGETYDARELPGWATPEKLATPEVNTEFQGEILPSEGAEIYFRKDLVLNPVRTLVWEGAEGAVEAEKKEDVEYGKIVVKREYAAGEEVVLQPGETLVVDFGQNASAVPSFVFQAAEGTVLTCLPGEILNDGNGAERRNMDGPEGSVHRRNLRDRGGWFRLIYTFAGNADFVSYYPQCTFFGYRYISVTATAPVRFRSIQSLPVSSITKEMETGTLTTGNGLINQLISNTVWGQRSNYLSVPTDCPQRDERLGWMADTQVFTETGSFFANTDRFFHKWLRDVRDMQSETGAYQGVAPVSMGGDGWMRLGWADAGIIVPWTVWKQFGDTEVIDESWDSMERFITHVDETKYDHVTLRPENGNYQWADWLSYEPLENCSGGAFQPDGHPWPDAIRYWSYLSASYWVIDAGLMKDMAAATGRDAAKYADMEKRAKDYIKSEFMNPDGTFKTAILNTMQTPALFALKNGLVEGKAREDMLSRLRRNFEEHGNCLQTGFLGTSILMDVLTDNGMTDIAYELLFQRKNPSWLYSVDNGATTIWERWNSYMVDKGMGPNGMNSFNHYAYGCVCAWIWKTAAGIAADPANPGFKHIIMKPVPDKRLGHIEASYPSAAGLIKSAWRYEGDRWIWEFTIPEGATASVTLPGETEVKEYAAGSYRLETEG